MGNTAYVVLQDKSVSLFIFFFIGIKKPQLYLHVCRVAVLCFAGEIWHEICKGHVFWISLSLREKVSDNVGEFRTKLFSD